MRNLRRLVPLLAAALTTAAAAQVGHAPNDSPYTDIRRGHTLTFLGGTIGGDGGRFEIGPHDGSVFGVRYDIRTSRPLQLGLGIMHSQLDRMIVDQFVQLSQRVSGPVRQPMTFAEFDLQLNLTGGKSWHRIAPFAGAGTGVAFGGSTPADTSGYSFRRKFYFVPHAGTRIFITQRLHLRAEARMAFWKLSYPVSFQHEPPAQPGVGGNSNAVITNGSTSEWTTNTWLQVGLGYGFSP